MKQYLYTISAIILTIFFLTTSTAQAAATLPNTAVWFTPTTAAAGAPITLNALVYNNQSVAATVTVQFTTATVKIATIVASIPSATAKTISVNWTMPASTTTVTATVVTAVNVKKQSLPALLGVIGTTNLSTSAATTVVDGLTVPSNVSNWIGSFIANVESFRMKEAVSFATQRDALKKTVSTTTASILSNPLNYINLIYTTCAATIFANQALFYIVAILIILLLLRFIVNLIF